ncbi:MAG: hypothetical protein HKN91_13135 [Acidimicrobiia bacterium]|nr:hypothetical protein [Acidimicrobiia bacterium]
MRFAALALIVLVAACGSSVNAPSITCQDDAGSGVLEEDILGSWSFINNASRSTFTFREDGTRLVYRGTDEPGREAGQYNGSWNLGTPDVSHVTLQWASVTLTVDFELVDANRWTVSRNGSDLDWSRCG